MTPLAAQWDAAYTAGTFDGFQDIDQQARYTVIGEAVNGSASVLDVGCGLGHLRSYVRFLYTGLDLSDVAISKARNKWSSDPAASQFICSDAETWTPDRQFHAVVLNEFLYYTSNPLASLQTWGARIKKGGLLVVSIREMYGANWRWFAKHPNASALNPNMYALRVARNFAGENLKSEQQVQQNGKQWTVLVIHC